MPDFNRIWNEYRGPLDDRYGEAFQIRYRRRIGGVNSQTRASDDARPDIESIVGIYVNDPAVPNGLEPRGRNGMTGDFMRSVSSISVTFYRSDGLTHVPGDLDLVKRLVDGALFSVVGSQADDLNSVTLMLAAAEAEE